MDIAQIVTPVGKNYLNRLASKFDIMLEIAKIPFFLIN